VGAGDSFIGTLGANRKKNICKEKTKQCASLSVQKDGAQGMFILRN